MKKLIFIGCLVGCLVGCSSKAYTYNRAFEISLECQSIDAGYDIIETYAYDDTVYVQILEMNGIQYKKIIACDGCDNIISITIEEYMQQETAGNN